MIEQNAIPFITQVMLPTSLLWRCCNSNGRAQSCTDGQMSEESQTLRQRQRDLETEAEALKQEETLRGMSWGSQTLSMVPQHEEQGGKFIAHCLNAVSPNP